MTTISPRVVDVGGFAVRRLLPSRYARAAGPWVFLDHMGPHTFAAETGADVIPHPHINLATVTYLFDGEIVHRDSLGTVQAIEPGAINLMIAGSGIAHSERTAPERRRGPHGFHGLQLWLALPEDREEDAPSFQHCAATDLPQTIMGTVTVRVMIGTAYGLESPVTTLSPTLFAQLDIDAGASVPLPEVQELAVYPIAGSGVEVGGELVAPGTLLVVGDDSARGTAISAADDTRVILIGGRSVGKRYMWWNFVSSRADRIEKAKLDWARGAFGPVAGDPGEPARLPEADSHSRMT